MVKRLRVGVEGRFWRTSGKGVSEKVMKSGERRTQHLAVANVGSHGVDNGKGEFALCEVFRKTLVI